jgi:very-short-patch-repair endonuclease
MGEVMLGQTNKKILSNRLQRMLRNEMTDAEKALWKHLRCRQVSVFKFRRQHPFGDYILEQQTHPLPNPPLEREGT